MLIAAIAFDPASATAQSLVLLDCQGFTRAVSEVNPGTSNSVSISVTGEGQVSITNVATGQTITATAQNGVATFPNISGGVFTVSSPSTVSIGAIGIAPTGFGPVVAGSAAVGAGVAGSGAAVGTAGGVTNVVDIATGNNNNNDNDDDNSDGGNGNATPTPSAPQPTAVPTSTPTPLPPTPTPLPPEPTFTPTPEKCDCDPDARPTPVGTFFPNSASAKKKPVSPFSFLFSRRSVG